MPATKDYSVFHAVNPTFGASEVAFPSGFRAVAYIPDAASLEDAFRLTNTIDAVWWDNPSVKALVGPTRSTSVGDVIIEAVDGRDGVAWRVLGVGFEKLDFRASGVGV